MVKRFFSRLRRWSGVQTFRTRVARPFINWPPGEIETLGDVRIWSSIGPAPRPAAETAATVEMRFMRLHSEGRFEDMWEMLADDAQRAWGSLQNFIREMPRLDEWLEILDMQVADVTMLDSWTDQRHEHTYDNVARLVMRYRVRQQWKEWTFDRQVHLVPAGGGWRTLCYPTRMAAGH